MRENRNRASWIFLPIFYAENAKKAKDEGNTEEVNRLTKKYQTLMYAMSGVLASAATLGPAAGFMTYAIKK